jgi:peptidoglycan-N-acetylglucosamine deacetylase
MTDIALTFDDGPDPIWTPRVIEALGEHRARATFFVVASQAEAYPLLMKRMLRAGHAVGLHCDEHVQHTDRDERWLRRDTARGLARLAEVGIHPTLWRTPWGVEAPWTEKVARHHALQLMGWTVDTHDWRGDTAVDMQRSIGKLRGGGVVLAHDGIGPEARREDCSNTVELVHRVAARAAQHGQRLIALGPERLAA